MTYKKTITYKLPMDCFLNSYFLKRENKMETRIRGVFPRNGRFKGVDIFAYTSKGIPGIDVVGMGTLSKKLKEKIIYLARLNQLKIPLRKYVICVDEIGAKELSSEEKIWLELPVLILFLAISKQIPIKKLDDCFCSGRIFPTGKLMSLEFPRDVLEKWKGAGENDYKYIAPVNFRATSELRSLPIESLLGHIPNFKYCSTSAS